tara:strand:- start:174 stop:980 length:807 start_codon:yes stop_codon:yes gene_type:complete
MHVDGGNNRVAIGASNAQYPFDVYGGNGVNGAARNNAVFIDTTSANIGTGGGIALGGYTNGTSGLINHFGNIQGIKENSTAGNYASAMIFSTRANGATPVERMRIGSTGAVTITNSLNINYGNVVLTSGYGIDFSATGDGPTMTSELLDDYEEGTWTLTDQSGAGLSLTVYVATYTKIGNQVFFEIGMLFPTTSNTTEIKLSLPFTAKNTNDNTGGAAMTTTNSGRNDSLVVGRNTAFLHVQSNLNAGATNANYSGKQLRCAGQYTTA